MTVSATIPATANPAASVPIAVSATFAAEAQHLLERGDAAAAIALCRKGLEAHPDYVTAYLILARACISIGDYVSAEQALERGVKKAPRSTTSRSLRKEVQYAIRFNKINGLAPVPRHSDILENTNEYEPDTTLSSLQNSLQNSPQSSAPYGIQSALAEASAVVDFLDRGVDVPAEQTERTLGTYLRIIETDKSSHEQQSSFRSNNLRLIPGLEFTPLRVENTPAAQSGERQRTGTATPEPPPLMEFADWQQYQEPADVAEAGAVPLTDLAVEMLKPQTGYTRSPMPVSRFSIREIESLPVAQSNADSDTSGSEIDTLASRLLYAQMPNVHDLMDLDAEIPQYLRDNSGETVSDTQADAGTVIISETMAKIYEAQGALHQALYAYSTLKEQASAQQDTQKTEFFAEKVRDVQAKIDALQTT
jgi:tetratricopeptide (TPR) repeat protein